MEAGRIELPSESTLLKASPGAVCDLKFASPVSRKQDKGLASFIYFRFYLKALTDSVPH